MIVLMSNGNFSLSLRLLEHISFGVSKDERLSFSLTLCFYHPEIVPSVLI